MYFKKLYIRNNFYNVSLLAKEVGLEVNGEN
jgi:hypothetical protein